VPDIHLTGVDIQADLIARATSGAVLNLGTHPPEFIVADICDFAPPALFDHIICNPPYLADGTYTPSPDTSRDLALGHHGRDLGLEDWLRAAHRLLKSRGTLTLIHRADHLDQILKGLGKRFGAIEIIPLWPHAHEDAKRVIVRTIKDRRDPIILHAGITLHSADGAWTDAARAVLNDMAPI